MSLSTKVESKKSTVTQPEFHSVEPNVAQEFRSIVEGRQFISRTRGTTAQMEALQKVLQVCVDKQAQDPAIRSELQKLVPECFSKNGHATVKLSGKWDATTEKLVGYFQDHYSVNFETGNAIRVTESTKERGLHQDFTVGCRTSRVLLLLAGCDKQVTSFDDFKKTSFGVWDKSHGPMWLVGDAMNARVADLKTRMTGPFLSRVDKIAESLSIPSEWLLAVMSFESRLDPSAVNPDSHATGLIQFTPNTAKWLGTSVAELRNMSSEEQLGYVGEYLMRSANGRKINSVGDLYLLIFKPAAFGAAPDAPLYRAGSAEYSQNAGLDKERNGYITRRDLQHAAESMMPNLSSLNLPKKGNKDSDG